MKSPAKTSPNRKTRIVLGALVTLASLMTTPLLWAQEKITIKIGHIAASDSYLISHQLGGLRDALEKTGKVNVIMYGTGSPFSNPTKFSELVEKGVLDIAYGIQQFEGNRYELNLLLSSPMMIDDSVKATRAYQRLVRTTPALAKEFAPNRLMTVSFASGEVLHMHKANVRSVDDLKSMRILSTNPGVQNLLRDLGASVAAIPSSASYENLQKGVVDGVSASWTNVGAFNLTEVTCCHYELFSGTAEVYVAINQNRYNTLPPEVKKVIDDYSTESAAVGITQAFLDVDAQARNDVIKKGHTIVTPTKAQRDAIKKRFQHFIDEKVADLEKRGLPAQQVVTRFLNDTK